MTLDEFEKQPRGPALFDCYHHPVLVGSPLGNFVVELQTEMDVPPTEEMVGQARKLLERFQRDAALLSGLVYEAYLVACSETSWMAEVGVPLQLELIQIKEHLTGRALVVADDLASAYMCPAWDEEHGLAFDLIEDVWERAD